MGSNDVKKIEKELKKKDKKALKSIDAVLKKLRKQGGRPDLV